MPSPRSVLWGGTLVWVLLGLLGVCWTDQSQEIETQKLENQTQKIEKFGCVFDNEDYFVPSRSIYLPVYGKEVAPMDFASVEEFQDVLKDIKAEYGKVLEEFVSTNIPVFVNFYDEFKKSSENEEEPQKFLRRYVPKFLPHQDPAGITIELLDRLVNVHPNMSRSVYLVTAAEDMAEGASDKLRKALDVEMFWQNQSSRSENRSNPFKIEEPLRILFNNKHVAGVLRIRIEGNRLGYVLLDPGFSSQVYDRPLVIMEDGEAPHEATLEAGEGSTGIYLPRPDYIVRGNQTYLTVKTLYYVGKPYCSFRMSTVKRAVLNTNLVMTRKNSTGRLTASLGIDASADEFQNFFFVCELYNNDNFNSLSENPKWFVDFGKRHEQEEDKQKSYQELISRLIHPDIEDLLARVETIAKDSEFLHKWEALREAAAVVEQSYNDERVIPF